MLIKAKDKQEKQKYKQKIRIAYITAGLSRTDVMPTLESLLNEPEDNPSSSMTEEERQIYLEEKLDSICL